MFQRMVMGLLVVVPCLWAGQAAAEPLAEKYLLEGKLADGEKALKGQLEKAAGDDQARFGLGVVQFLQTFEHLGQSLYRYGLRTETAAGAREAPGGGQGVPLLRDLLPQNPKPEQVSYQAVRQIVQTWVDDLVKAEATLAQIKDPAVKLPLHVGRIQLDLTGQGKPVSAAFLFERQGSPIPKAQVENFVIGFDRGDVCWFRGYCHFLAGWGELLLAVDGQELFNGTAHVFFEKPDSPYPFLQEDRPRVDNVGWNNAALISDAIAALHLLRLPIKEPARPKAALEHFEATLAMAKEMWTFILAETDDDNEWIPNPRQKGVLQVAVSQEMIDTWLATVDEAQQVLQAKRLVPFWRGKQADRGINLRRVFTEPRTFDPIFWFQGTAATPYLEKGEVTKLADPRLLERISNAFGGGRTFAGFAFWFN